MMGNTSEAALQLDGADSSGKAFGQNGVWKLAQLGNAFFGPSAIAGVVGDAEFEALRDDRTGGSSQADRECGVGHGAKLLQFILSPCAIGINERLDAQFPATFGHRPERTAEESRQSAVGVRPEKLIIGG